MTCVSDRHVIVHRSFDPIQIEHLAEILRDAGIAARVQGNASAALVGVGGNTLEAVLAVPENQAGEATDFLEAYFAAESDDAAARSDEAGSDVVDDDDDEDEDQAPGEVQLSSLLAAGCSLILACGHVYARSYVTGLMLFAAQFWAAWLTVSWEWTTVATGAMFLTLIKIADLVGGLVAVRAYNRGARRSIPLQVAIGAVLIAGALGLASLLGRVMPEPEIEDDPSSVPVPAAY